jgi:gliding motility-associated-like protein
MSRYHTEFIRLFFLLYCFTAVVAHGQLPPAKQQKTAFPTADVPKNNHSTPFSLQEKTILPYAPFQTQHSFISPTGQNNLPIVPAHQHQHTNGTQVQPMPHQPPARNKEYEFTENKGQWHDNIRYQCQMRAARLYLENNRLTYFFLKPEQIAKLHPYPPSKEELPHLDGHVYRVNFVGANPAPTLTPQTAHSATENYFIGNDPKQWATGVRSFQRVSYRALYPDIDLQIYSNQNHIKYDFIVYPGGDAQSIRLQYEGVDKLSIRNGQLHIQTSVNEVVEDRPHVFQHINGKDVDVPCEYRFLAGCSNEIGFYFPNGYDKRYPLIIDPPVLIFSTFTGAFSDNWGMTATFDEQGNFYTGGIVLGPSYPETTGRVQAVYGDGIDRENSVGSLVYGCDMSISKYNPEGTRILYSTFLGGRNNDQPMSFITNRNGELFLLGATRSNNFPTTNDAFDRTFSNANGGNVDDIDMVVVRLNANGTELLGSSYLGGSNYDGVNRIKYPSQSSPEPLDNPLYYFFADDGRGEIVIDAQDNCYVISSSSSPDFPVSPNAIQPQLGGLQDAVICKINPTMSILEWATFLGGSYFDAGYSVKLAANNELIISGGTAALGRNSATALQLPNTNGWRQAYQGGDADGFLARIANSGDRIINATYVGTDRFDQTYFTDFDNDGNVYITGLTEGNFFTANTQYNVPDAKQFITKFRQDLSDVIFSFKFGSGDRSRTHPDITITAFMVDKCENIYVTGWGGTNMPPLDERDDTPPEERKVGNTQGLEITNDAFQRTTDGNDFYLACFSANAERLIYATYMGDPVTADHVDGGTCRFDKNGVVYHSVCGGCAASSSLRPRVPSSSFPTFPPNVVSTTNNSRNCNNVSFKFFFDVLKKIDAEPISRLLGTNNGCVPYSFQFTPIALIKEMGIRLDSTNAEFYWDFGYKGAVSREFSPRFVYPEVGEYTIRLRVKNKALCTVDGEGIIKVRVFDVPKIAIDLQRESVCNYTIKLRNLTTNALDHIWDFGDGTTSTEKDIDSHTYPGPGTYTLTYRVDPNSPCPGKKDTSYTIVLPPQPKAAFEINQQRCFYTVNFRSTIATDSLLNYRYAISDGTTYRTPEFAHRFTQPGNYTVTQYIAEGTPCVDSASQTLFIEPPSIADFVIDTLLCVPTAALFNRSQNATTYLWDFGDGATSTEMNPSYTYPRLGRYTIRLIAEPFTDCADTAFRTVTVGLRRQASYTLSYNPCELVVSAINSSDTAAQSYRWELSDGTVYRTRDWTHRFNTTGDFSVKLTVNGETPCPSLPPVQFIQLFPDARADFGSKPIRCDWQGHFFDKVGLGIDYKWDFGDGTTGTGLRPTHQYRAPGRYKVRLIVDEGRPCEAVDSMEVIVPFRPEAQFKYDTVFCSPFVTFTDQSIDTQEWLWRFGDGKTDTVPNPVHRFKRKGIYRVQLLANLSSFCPDSTEQWVTVTAPSLVTLSTNDTICDTTKVVYLTENEAGVFAWYVTRGEMFDPQTPPISRKPSFPFAFSQPGTYRIFLLIDPDSLCPDTIDQLIRVHRMPIPRFTYTSPPCDFTLALRDSSEYAFQWNWSFGDGNFAIGPKVEHRFKRTSEYPVQLTVNQDSFCFARIRQNIFVGYPTQIFFTFASDRCDTLFTFTNRTQKGSTFLWDFGDGNTSTERSPTHQYDQPGMYTVTLTVDKGTPCERDYELTVRKDPKPIPDFRWEQEVCEAELQLVQVSIDGQTYLWEAGKLGRYGGQRPRIRYPHPGVYPIKLITWDVHGCADSITKLVPYDPYGLDYLFIPNVFSPNGDGQNERFEIRGVNTECVESLSIFSRWGQLIFETNDINNFWDGRFKGEWVQEGAYVYVLRTPLGSARAGTVTVLR